jgi:hypothetical protein
MKVLCIGCSWTDKWPDYLKFISPIKRSLHGEGLSLIKDKCKWNTTIKQTRFN